jgi:anti-sigma regulatory factor (Ser/Thr protein kinase)
VQHILTGGFHHEAVFYADVDDYLAGTVPYLREGLDHGDRMLVAVGAAKRRLIEGELGADADAIRFVDMVELGRNPARIIPAWADFVADHGGNGRSLRGIGEPIWPGRTAPEIVECQSHESLLNLAFDDGPAWSLLCPYDMTRLDADVLEEAQRSHPFVSRRGASVESAAYVAPLDGAGPFAASLSPRPWDAPEVAFDTRSIGGVRSLLADRAAAAGLDADRTADFVLAVSELATNAVRHAGGHGTVRVWREDSTLLCEVEDRGRIHRPLAGRERPSTEALTGRGLWLVNHVCDLVQIRSLPDGNLVRLHMQL